MIDVKRCPVCASTNRRRVRTMSLHAADFAHREAELSRTNDYHRNWLLFDQILPTETESLDVEFFSCRSCSLIYFSPRPTEADMLKKYGAIQTDRDTQARERLGSPRDIRARRSSAIRERLGQISFRCGRVLDIGGADGHCLDAFRDEATCAVSDYEERQMWPGVEHLGPPPLSEDHLESFDVVLMCHIVEHLVDPLGELIERSKLLRPGGSLYVEVPFGWGLEPFFTRNVMTHINFFSVPSVCRLLSAAGLDVIDVRLEAVLSSQRSLPVIWAHARRTERVQTRPGHGDSPSRSAAGRLVDAAELVPKLLIDNVRILRDR